MKRRSKSKATQRHAELRAILESRRKALTGHVSDMMRHVRTRSVDDRDVVDTHEGADVDSQDDLDLALIQMKAETLARIDAALRRIDTNSYGNCAECAEAIPSERLRALPFAVRCTACEDARERKSRGTFPRPRRIGSYLSFDATE